MSLCLGQRIATFADDAPLPTEFVVAQSPAMGDS